MAELYVDHELRLDSWYKILSILNLQARFVKFMTPTSLPPKVGVSSAYTLLSSDPTRGITLGMLFIVELVEFMNPTDMGIKDSTRVG